MTLAAGSLFALLATMAASCFLPINAGVLGLVLAFVVGHVFGKAPIAQIMAGFPASLFLTLTGVTLLFSQARVNGTLESIAARAIRLTRGNPAFIPIIFFVLTTALSAVGVGNIGAVALLAPLGMSVAGRMGISGFLMTLMLANGGNAGVFSPFAPGGIIAHGLMEKAGIHGADWSNFLNTLVAQTVVAMAGYFLFGGLKLIRRGRGGDSGAALAQSFPTSPFTGAQRLTLAVIVGLIVGVLFFKIDIGMGAFMGAIVLSLARAADEEEAVKVVPWSVILMVCGLTMLVDVVSKTGGMDLFTGLLAKVSNATFAPGFIALVAGIVSVYASSTGVVVPAFLAAVPGLVARLPGSDALMLAYSVNVGALVVDVSPVSTLGALCLAAAAPQEDRKLLFRKLMAWGWSMVLVGGIVCQLLFGYR